jgi:hypothetical protein
MAAPRFKLHDLVEFTVTVRFPLEGLGPNLEARFEIRKTEPKLVVITEVDAAPGRTAYYTILVSGDPDADGKAATYRFVRERWVTLAH